MAINYSIAKMKNPAEPDVYKYYPKAQASGSVEINELAEEIAYATTLTDGDVLNVIRAKVCKTYSSYHSICTYELRQLYC